MYEISLEEIKNNEEIQELLAKNTVSVNCPCGANVFTLPLFFDEETTVQCDKCNGLFRLEISVEPTIITEPVNIQNVYDSMMKIQQSES